MSKNPDRKSKIYYSTSGEHKKDKYTSRKKKIREGKENPYSLSDKKNKKPKEKEIKDYKNNLTNYEEILKGNKKAENFYKKSTQKTAKTRNKKSKFSSKIVWYIFLLFLFLGAYYFFIFFIFR